MSEALCAVIGWTAVWNGEEKKCVKSFDTWATQRNEKWKCNSKMDLIYMLSRWEMVEPDSG